jgi:hypothetical protein
MGSNFTASNSTSNGTLSFTAQLACRYPNTTIPQPPYISSSSDASCAISSFFPAAEILLSQCCNTTSGHVVKNNQDIAFMGEQLMNQVTTGGYNDASGCSWTYCNVTGQGGMDLFTNCIKDSETSSGTKVQGQCFMGGAKSQLAVTSGADKVKWRNEKKKDTIGAALLMALGVAGLIIGGA